MSKCRVCDIEFEECCDICVSCQCRVEEKFYWLHEEELSDALEIAALGATIYAATANARREREKEDEYKKKLLSIRRKMTFERLVSSLKQVLFDSAGGTTVASSSRAFGIEIEKLAETIVASDDWNGR